MSLYYKLRHALVVSSLYILYWNYFFFVADFGDSMVSALVDEFRVPLSEAGFNPDKVEVEFTLLKSFLQERYL